jgi:hypothetical protein
MIITAASFIILVKWYYNRLLPLFRQFFLAPNRTNEFMDLKTIYFHLLLESVLHNLTTVWQYILSRRCKSNFYLKYCKNQKINLLGFKEEIIKGIHVDIARSRSCSQEACPLPEINTEF